MDRPDTPHRPATGEAPLFLARRTYRRRRLMDAARLLPLAGCVLFLLPLLWVPGTAENPGARTATGGIYIFLVWILLIVAAAGLSRPLRQGEPGERGQDRDPET